MPPRAEGWRTSAGTGATAPRPITARESGVAGLTGARAAIFGSVKIAGHAHLALLAFRSHRKVRWLLAGVASVVLDVAMVRRLRGPAYQPGPRFALAELADTALWSIASGDRPSDVDVILDANSLAASVLAAWTVATGTEAVPVYDPGRPFPPRGRHEVLRALATVLRPILLPTAVAVVVRRIRGRRTHASAVMWGIEGAILGFVTARQRNLLQARTRRLWEARARAIVEREEANSRLAMATSSSPGHDFKKTLFALGLAGSKPAMREAMRQGAHPAQEIERTRGDLLAEASHHLPVDPPVEAMRILTAAQVARIRSFLAEAERDAVDGADQTLRVEVVPPFGFSLDYLGSRLELANEPPPLVARLNPTAVAFGIGALLKSFDLVMPIGGWMPRWVRVPLLACDLSGAVRYWRRPPTPDDLPGAFALAAVPAAVGIACSATRMTALVDREGGEVFPAVYFLRDFLYEVFPNWSVYGRPYRAVAAGLVVCSAAASAVRRRGQQDWVRLFVEYSYAATAFSVFGLADRVEEEAALLEQVEFEWFAAQVAGARERGVEAEVARYRRHAAVARRALADLVDLRPDLRVAIESDCDELDAWLRSRDERVGAAT